MQHIKCFGNLYSQEKSEPSNTESAPFSDAFWTKCIIDDIGRITNVEFSWVENYQDADIIISAGEFTSGVYIENSPVCANPARKGTIFLIKTKTTDVLKDFRRDCMIGAVAYYCDTILAGQDHGLSVLGGLLHSARK